MGPPKFKTSHVTLPRPFHEALLSIGSGCSAATVNLYTKHEVCMFTHYADMKGDEKCKNWSGLG